MSMSVETAAQIANAATETIDRLLARIAELEAALRPFAKAGEAIDIPEVAKATGNGQPITDNELLWAGQTGDLYGRDFRRARAALTIAKEQRQWASPSSSFALTHLPSAPTSATIWPTFWIASSSRTSIFRAKPMLDALEAAAERSLELAARPLPSGQPVPLPPLVEAAIGASLAKFF